MICVSLKIEITYPDSKDRSDLVGTLGQLGQVHLVARKLLNLVLLGSQAGTSRRQCMKQIPTFSRLGRCTLAINFLGLKSRANLVTIVIEKLTYI